MSAAAPGPRARVLIVDDHPLNIELARFVLEADGLAVDVAADAGQALERIAARRPDVILMDVQLPGLDGLTLARRLKDDPATCTIPIAAFTAYAMKGDAARMLAAGCDGYLSKPIDVARFAAQVRALIRDDGGIGA
ncbi:MAG: response regulator [Burkholderiaceae bacterium]|nr:response regulator [Burkholderiaceae bacterium]